MLQQKNAAPRSFKLALGSLLIAAEPLISTLDAKTPKHRS